MKSANRIHLWQAAVKTETLNIYKRSKVTNITIHLHSHGDSPVTWVGPTGAGPQQKSSGPRQK